VNMVRASTLALSITLIVGWLAIQKHPPRSAIEQQKDSVAAVTVLAFNSWRGNRLDPPIIRQFKSEENGKDFTKLFHQNAAEGIPFGEYRVEVYLPDYTSALRVVNVYQRNVTIVVGLVIVPEISPISLHGRVVGLQASATTGTFVKLSGVYSDASTESAIDSKGEFDMSVLLPGKYVLTVVNVEGIVASRVLTIPYDGPALQIEVGSGPIAPTGGTR
jgi:hypothetical protein